MMKSDEIVKALKHLRVQTGSLACMGCGHEHDCGVHGCAIMRQAADLIERLEKEKAALLESVRGGCISCKHWRGTRSIATLLAGARRAAKTANAKTAASERTGSGKDWSRKRRRRGKMDEMKILEMALETFGGGAQIVVAIEEMSELQKELCKSLRGSGNVENIAEEIADAQIMLEQMTMLFGCGQSVESVRQKKLQRLEMRIEKARKDGGDLSVHD